MSAMLAISRMIDAINERLGKAMGWFILAAVIVSSVNALIRYSFNLSSNAWLEMQWYLFGAVFLLAAAYTLQANEHIRIDIVSGQLSKRTRDWIDIVGHIFFLMPFVLIDHVAVLAVLHALLRPAAKCRRNAGGLIIWPAQASGSARLLAPASCKAISELIKRIAIMHGPHRRPA